MPRLQFSLKTLLWLMVAAAAYCVGIATGRRLEQSQLQAGPEGPDSGFIDYPEYPDARLWHRRTTAAQPKESAQ
jgi:hypothetical protein